MLSSLIRNWCKQIFHRNKRKYSTRSTSQQQDISALIQKADEQYQQGNHLQAEKLYQEILESYPDEPNACHRLGRLKGQIGNITTARMYLEKAIAAVPDFADAYSDLGNISKLQDNLEEAHNYYQKAVSLEPDNLAARCNLGISYLDLGKKSEALATLKKIVTNNPEFMRGRFLYGQALLKSGKYEKAARQLEFVYSHEPSNGEVLNHLVSALINYRSFDRALELSQKALQVNPDNVEAHASMGLALLQMDRLDKGLDHLLRAEELNPRSSDVQNSIGMTMQYLGRMDEAYSHYNRAIQLKPTSYDARLNRSLAFLSMGEYEKGWSEYDMRFHQTSRYNREFPYPAWDGSRLNGRTLFVHAEQGLGDEIMFASCIPDLLRQEGKIILDCHPKLEPIFSRSFPEVTVHGGEQTDDIGWITEYEPIDVQLPIGSLPKFFRSSHSDFPDHSGYLSNNPKHVDAWKQRLDSLGTCTKIGISWQGGTDKTKKSRRVVDLKKWLPILQQPGFDFISLQYTDCQDELETFRQDHGIEIRHWQEVIDDYEQTASLVEALDLVISVQTAIVHLAGALGQTVWVMVPAIPEWRYGHRGNSMPWYPSARLFRQHKSREWDDVVKEIRENLLLIRKA